MSTLKDSGKRKEAGTGAVRDASDDKPEMSLLSPHVMPCPVLGQFLLDRDLAGLYKLSESLVKTVGWVRLCNHLSAGAAKYSRENWKAGMPLSWVVDSYLRHFVSLSNGETDEDHEAARFCNLTFLIHYVEELEAGRLDPALDDVMVPRVFITDTDQEVAQSNYVEEYITGLIWSPDTSDEIKTTVAGNLRAFHQHLFKDAAHNTEGTK